MDTIFAQASARGKAGVSVLRISGPEAFSAVRTLCGTLPAERRAAVRILKDADGADLDQALVLCFGEGRSFTGEETVELHLHGSVAIVGAVYQRLMDIGLRLAEPGEFTRRALENDRLDLTQVEGLADLIESETEAQRRQAMKVLTGDLGHMVGEWRTALIRASALIEATIDFADEEVPVDVSPEVGTLIDQVLSDLESQIRGSHMAERIRQGFEVAIVGAPNIGKSTLLNALAGRDAAITSEIAGTTRDVIEVRMDVGGLPVTFLDTAGLRTTDDKVEAIGVDRAIDRARSADLRIFLLSDPDETFAVEAQDGDLRLLGKSDVISGNSDAVSGKTGAGVAAMMDRVSGVLQSRLMPSTVATHARHRLAFADAKAHLELARDRLVFAQDQAELVAEELRSAIHRLDLLIGHVDVEHVLDEIFSSFCLGK